MKRDERRGKKRRQKKRQYETKQHKGGKVEMR